MCGHVITWLPVLPYVPPHYKDDGHWMFMLMCHLAKQPWQMDDCCADWYWHTMIHFPKYVEHLVWQESEYGTMNSWVNGLMGSWTWAHWPMGSLAMV